MSAAPPRLRQIRTTGATEGDFVRLVSGLWAPSDAELADLADVDLTGAVAGDVLGTADGSTWGPVAAGSGSAHVIQDEGTPLTQRANLDFVGSGVTVTDDGVDTTTVTIPGGSGGSSILADATWRAATFTQTASAPTTLGTISDINASLTVTFTAPASGGVKVSFCARMDITTTNDYFWTLRDSSNVEVTNARCLVGRTIGTYRVAPFMLITGLTSGSSYTWKWGHTQNGGTGSKVTSSGDMPAFMIVESA